MGSFDKTIIILTLVFQLIQFVNYILTLIASILGVKSKRDIRRRIILLQENQRQIREQQQQIQLDQNQLDQQQPIPLPPPEQTLITLNTEPSVNNQQLVLLHPRSIKSLNDLL
jgi:hypothetical protein